jgi:prepilin-type N-terminal cleavage/methylation domain-containing protein
MKARGFTLIELLVTVGIIAVLSSILLVNTNGSRAKARDAQRVSDLGQLQLSLQLYYDRCGQFPAGSSGALAVATATGCPAGVTLGTFISQVPTPPAGASQTAYDYATLTSSGVVVNYVLRAVLEQTNVATAKGLSAFPSGSGTWAPTSLSCTVNTVNYCVSAN